MNFWQVYIACAGGVVLSIAIPVLAKAVQKQFNVGGPAELGGVRLLMHAIWQQLRPYAILTAFSLTVALLVVAFMGESLRTWQLALLAGYAWDSTLQKVVGKP